MWRSSGKLEHSLCDRFAPGDPVLTGYAPMEENQQRLAKLEAEVAALKMPPAGFVVRESGCIKSKCFDAVGVVSRDGAMLGLIKNKKRR